MAHAQSVSRRLDMEDIKNSNCRRLQINAQDIRQCSKFESTRSHPQAMGTAKCYYNHKLSNITLYSPSGEYSNKY
uniref:Uncharacterized protein n=1 Tax=Setaria italica TaxID=4555 RepID=K4AHK6_SETIT